MPRRLRFAPPGYWLHLTQRGNNKQPVFTADEDRHHFLTLVGTLSEERQVRVAAYTLMTNHFHLVAVGDRSDAISLFMMDLNGQYATYRHATQRTTGHVWQNRFYSCVLDDAHWQTALGYVELNAVRAHLALSAGAYAWSSARAHLGRAKAPGWLDVDQFQQRWPTPANWQESLATLTRREAADLRRATRQDSALGSDTFIDHLERTHQIRLRAQPLGRPRKSPATASAFPLPAQASTA